jgi:trans-aconitate methyltransferase
MHITKDDVSSFKTAYCDENALIAHALATSFAEFLIEPIYDIGSGMGDITATSFPTREVVHVDILNYKPLLPPSHSNVIGDFFTFNAPTRIGSMLLCHVLQFLDEDVETLHSRIAKLSPKHLVVVQNNNDGFMKEVVEWMQDRYPSCNPEVAINGFGDTQRYRMVLERPVSATVTCPDYKILALQIHYLFDYEASTHSVAALAKWLESALPLPSFTIQQTIKGYQCLT